MPNTKHTQDKKEKSPLKVDLKSKPMDRGSWGDLIFTPAGRQNTMMAGMRANQAMMNMPGAAAIAARFQGSNTGLQDIINDEEALARAGGGPNSYDLGPLPEVKTANNLPAVISKAIVNGGGTLNPEWHQIKHLPGYLSNQIRVLGRSVFSLFTSTSIEDIQMVSTLTNSEIEVRAMMAWIAKNGVKNDSMTMDFEQSFPNNANTPFMEDMPSLTSEVQVWQTCDYTFVLVKDFAGYYVYGWPASNDRVGNDRKLKISKA